MPQDMIILIVVFVLVFAFAITMSVLQIKNQKKHYVCEYGGHNIEIKTSFTYCQLVLDGKIVDEIKSYQMRNTSLNVNIDDLDVKVRIGTGFIKPIVKVFINNQLVEVNEKKKELMDEFK